MYAALHDCDRQISQFANYELACVACNRGAREAGDFGVGDARRGGKFFGEGSETGAEDERNSGAEFGAREDEFCGAGGADEGVTDRGRFSRTHRSMIPTREAESRFAIVPAS